MSATIDPDRLAELEEERRFLLHSLTDLEREHDAGDVDQADYEALRDGYTSRAANVLRSIEQGMSSIPPKPPRRVGRIAGIAVAVVVVGVVLGVLVARFASPRGTGDTITGGTDRDRIAALLTDGRTAIAQADPTAATDSYLEVLRIDADNVEAQAYLGWVLALQAQDLVGEPRQTALDNGKQTLVTATVTDPTYPDSYCFLAIVAAQFDNDIPTAVARQDECLARDPSSEMQDLLTFLVQPVINPATTDAVG